MDRKLQLEEMLKKSPNDSFLKHALALEYMKEGNNTKAKTLLIEVLEHDPGYTGSYYHLGKLLERAGETEDAVRWYKRGLEITNITGERRAYNELLSAYEEISED